MKPTIAFHLNTLCHGGAERVVTNLANRFAKEGYGVIVATEWYDEDEFELDPKVRRIHVGLKESDEKKGRVAKFLARERYLHEFLLKEKPDVIVAFAQRALYRALMACRGTGVPVVVSVRIDPVRYYSALSDKIQIAWLFDRAAGGVFQTEDARKFFLPHLKDTGTVILNPITDKYIGVPQVPPQEKEKEVVNVARLADFKNQPLLVEAFALVLEKHPDYVLKFYGPDSGDGSKERIEETARRLGIEKSVLLMGGSDTLEQQVPKAQVFAYSSDYEGMPNSLMEAMAMGLACVATDCPPGGPRMLIEDGVNGYLIPCGDKEALADRILRLIEDPELADRMGQNARRISEIADTDTVFRQWESYLMEIIRSGRRC